MSSLRRRLLLGLLAGLLLLLGASAVLLYGTIRGRVLGQVDEGLERLAGVLAHMVEQDGSRLDFDELRESRAAAGQDGQQILYRIGRSDGAVLFESDPSAAALGAPPAPPPCSADLTLADGAPARALARSFQPRREPAARLLQVEAPRLWIWIAQDVAPQRRFLAGLRWALLLGGALTALAMAVLVLFVVRGALAPLQRVASAAEAIDAATLDRRFPEAVPAELARSRAGSTICSRGCSAPSPANANSTPRWPTSCVRRWPSCAPWPQARCGAPPAAGRRPTWRPTHSPSRCRWSGW